MTPRITFICHGTTRALRSATFGGDDPLDDAGRSGAERLAIRLGTVDACWSSPALRARETASALGLSPQIDERLRDCEYGRWTGLKFQQVLLREPGKLVSWIRKPATAPHGGESIPQVLQRVSAWMVERSRDRGHTVAITHSAVIRAAIVHVLQADLPSFWRIDILPLSQTDLRTNGRRWVLRTIVPASAREALDDELSAESSAASADESTIEATSSDESVS